MFTLENHIIVNASLPVLSNTNKQLIFDFYIEDDEHCFYNLEYQNGDLTYNERVRINLYAIRMVLEQAQRGQTYKDISRCYQGIYYMGHPLLMFKGFEDDYLKRVGSTGLPYDGENLISKIFTINRIDEQIEGKNHLTFIEQLSYLLLYDVPYPYEEPDELIKEVIQMIREFNEEDKARLQAFIDENQKKMLRTEIEESYDNGQNDGCIDTTLLVANMLRNAIKEMFYYVSPYLERFISKAKVEALSKALIVVSSIHNPDDLIPILQS